MPRTRRHPVQKGRPALVAVPTKRTVEIDGKTYRVLELKYDLEGKYMKPAMPIYH